MIGKHREEPDGEVRRMKRWDIKLEGTTCEVCEGTGWSTSIGDAHRSSGSVPCPRGLFQGHGFPSCQGGQLRFSDYDRENWNKLKRKKAYMV